MAVFLSGSFRSNDNSQQANSGSTNQSGSVSTPSQNPRPTASTTERPSPSSTATPFTPTVSPTQARAEVTSIMNQWAGSLSRRSINDNLSLYADRLDTFYGLRGVSKGQVRSNRQQIFNKYYSSTDVQLSNIRIDLDPSATNANVYYDNTYTWQGGMRYLSGKSRNQIILSRINGRWLIVGEVHLQQYYENKRD